MNQTSWDRLYSYRLARMAKLIKLNVPKSTIAAEACMVMLAARKQTKRRVAVSWLKEWYVAKQEFTYYWVVRFFLGEERADEVVFGITEPSEFDEDNVREIVK